VILIGALQNVYDDIIHGNGGCQRVNMYMSRPTLRGSARFPPVFLVPFVLTSSSRILYVDPGPGLAGGRPGGQGASEVV